MSDENEEKAEVCCDSYITKIQRMLEPISLWVPAIKNVVTSGADVVMDWMFYVRIAGDETGTVTEFVWPLFVFSVLSTVFLIMVISAEISGQCCPGCVNGCLDSKICCCCCSCMKTMKFILICEIILEDIPQIMISNWVRQAQSGWTTAAVVNIVTSAYNVVFDLICLLELTPQESEELAKRR